jgi:arsenite methyltransferase
MFDRRHPDQWKQQVRASFDTTGPGYGRPGDYHWAFAERLVALAPLQPAQRVLDVATGTAPAAILAAQRVGPLGYVVGSDLSPGMLVLASQHLAAARVGNVAVFASDAEELAVRDRSVEGVVCSSAIVWFPDIARAVGEWCRALVPGGWIAFSCFGGLARHTINTVVIKLLAPYGVGYAEVNTPLNSPDKCRTVVQAAGFTAVTVHTGTDQPFTLDPEASWAQAWASGSRFDLPVDPAQIAQIKAQYLAHFAQLTPTADHWNHDYEQFVVAYKPHTGA